MDLQTSRKAWADARSKLALLMPRLEKAKGESREAMIDIAANEILKAAWPEFAASSQ